MARAFRSAYRILVTQPEIAAQLQGPIALRLAGFVRAESLRIHLCISSKKQSISINHRPTDIFVFSVSAFLESFFSLKLEGFFCEGNIYFCVRMRADMFSSGEDVGVYGID